MAIVESPPVPPKSLKRPLDLRPDMECWLAKAGAGGYERKKRPVSRLKYQG